MKRNKVLSVVLFMTSVEKLNFENYIAKHGNANHKKLFKLLQQVTTEDFDIASLFKALYKRPYTTAEDYLLRNDLRHLGKHLQQFICGDKHENEWEALLYFLKWLLQQKGYSLFAIEWRKAQSKLVDLQYYRYLYELNQLQVTYLRSTEPPSKQLFISLEALAVQNQGYIKQICAEEALSNELGRAFARRSLKSYAADLPLSLADVPADIETLVAENTYLHFLWLKAQSYVEMGLNKVDTLKAIKALLPNIAHRVDATQEMLICKASIALEYYLHDNDTEALTYYAEVIPSIQKLNPQQQLSVLFNYTTTLLRNQNYELVIQLINSNLPAIKKASIADRFYCIWAMCYLFLGRVNEAYNCLPANFLKYSRHDHFYLRCVLSIIFYQQGNLELALTEMKNLKQAQVYVKDTAQNISETMEFLQRFYRLQEDQMALPNYPAAKKALLKELNAVLNASNDVNSSNILPMAWLANQLKG